ncbi:MAG: ribbon-helix-helix protein, CopG family [Armatimonadetes bacterium]|nr:ribbon-helix-helix protein, CopG family [Armatimonadota bacterium]
MAKAQEDTARRVVVRALFEEGMVAELDALAQAAHTSRSEVLRRLVLQALEEADGDEEDWSALSHRMLLAEYGPEDEGLYDDPEAIGATPIQW